MKPITYAEFDPLTRLHFALFVERVFAEVEPGKLFLDNFHMHVIYEALEDLYASRGRRLGVAMPPRSLKSVIISVAWVAWLLGHDPTLRIICVSYSQELADKMASLCRQVMQSDWYKRLYPGTRLTFGRQALANFETTAGGGRFSTSIGGTLTGFGGDWIIVDDPMKPSEALSDAERANTNDWIQHSLFTRLNDKLAGRVIVVMQRLHEDDVLGSLAEKAGTTFRMLSFAAIAQCDELHTFDTPFGRREFLRREGEALHPAREPLHVLEEQRLLISTRFFSAQYLQAPVPAEGNFVRYTWFPRYNLFEIAQPERVIQSWDTASKVGQLNDYSVCTTWAIREGRYYLIDVFRERLEFPDLKRRVVELADRYNPERVLIEDKGSGTSLIQELQYTGFGNAHAVNPTADKVSRFVGITAMIEQGRVYLPHSAVWLDPFVDELCGFPGLRHDDQVDSTSQFLEWARDEDNPGGLWHATRQAHEQKVAFTEHRTEHLRAPPGVSHFFGRDGTCHSVLYDGTIWLSGQDAGSAALGGFVRLPG